MKKQNKKQPKTVVGLEEKITLIGTKKRKTVLARIDTGARRCSVDSELANEIGIGPVVKKQKVKSASGVTVRKVHKIKVKFMDKIIITKFNTANRKNMTYDVLIGRNLLSGHDFIIDPDK